MRYLTLIFFLAMGLATAARVQNFTVELLGTSTANFVATTDNLNFNPTLSSSPYPFRSIPVAQPNLNCFNLAFENPDTVEPKCFKNFPQFFKPFTTASTPADVDGYRLQVCNSSNPLVRRQFNLTMELTNFVQSPNSTPYPPLGASAASQIDQNQILYKLNGGDWQAAPVTPTVRSLDSGFLPTTPLSIERCRTYDLKLRLRLNGTEEFLSDSISTKVTFKVTP